MLLQMRPLHMSNLTDLLLHSRLRAGAVSAWRMIWQITWYMMPALLSAVAATVVGR